MAYSSGFSQFERSLALYFCRGQPADLLAAHLGLLDRHRRAGGPHPREELPLLGSRESLGQGAEPGRDVVQAGGGRHVVDHAVPVGLDRLRGIEHDPAAGILLEARVEILQHRFGHRQDLAGEECLVAGVVPAVEHQGDQFRPLVPGILPVGAEHVLGLVAGAVPAVVAVGIGAPDGHRFGEVAAFGAVVEPRAGLGQRAAPPRRSERAGPSSRSRRRPASGDTCGGRSATSGNRPRPASRRCRACRTVSARR